MSDNKPLAITLTEAGLIGSIIIYSDVASRLHPNLEGKHFSDSGLGHVYDMIRARLARGLPIDAHSLAADLPERMVDTIQECVAMAAAGANAPYFSESILAAGVRRELALRLSELADMATDRNAIGSNVESLAEVMGQVQAALQAAADATQNDAASEGLDATDGMALVLKEAEDARLGNKRGLPTGIPMIDRLTGGLRPSTMWIVGARPGVGKSVMLWQMACKAASKGAKAVLVSAEMVAGDYYRRLACQATGLPFVSIAEGSLSNAEWTELAAACNRIANRFGNRLTVLDRLGSDISRIMPVLHRMRQRGSLDVVMIDFVQRLNAGKLVGRGHNRNQELELISRMLADFSKETGAAVVLASQFSRPQEAKSPTLASLRDSGALEQDADVVLLLHKPDETVEGRECIVAKNRQGAPGNVKLALDVKKLSFYEQEVGRDG